MMFRTVLLAPISAASLSAAEFQFVHAGLLRNSADLARMNEAVAAREEPIFAGYEVFAPIRSRRLREPYRSRCSVHSESCREGAAARSSAGRRPHGVRNALVHSAKRPRHRAGRIRAAGCGDCGAGCATIRLTSIQPRGAASCTVERPTSKAGPYAPIATNLRSAEYIDARVKSGTLYYYVMTAVGADSLETSMTAGLPAPWQHWLPRCEERIGNVRIGM
jgi:hypothetical protein